MGAAVSGYQPITSQPSDNKFPGAGPVLAPGGVTTGRVEVNAPERRENPMAIGNKQAQVDGAYKDETRKKKRMKKIPAKPRISTSPTRSVPGGRNPLREMLGMSGGE